MEATILRTFIQRGRIKHWAARPDCPPVIQEFTPLFDKYTFRKYHDTDFAFGDNGESSDEGDEGVTVVSIPNPTENFPHDLRDVVFGVRPSLHSRFRVNGQLFSVADLHVGNSLVLFCPTMGSPLQVTGSIKYICQFPHRICFAIQRHLPRAPDVVDPFGFYADFPALLCSSRLSEKVELVDVDAVESHCAQYRFNDDHVVVISLSQVSARMLPIAIKGAHELI